MLLSLFGAQADQGRLTQDLTVGAAHDVQLKTGQVVQILKHSATSTVIMVQLPDGSNGIFQVNPAALEIMTPSAPAVVPIPAQAAAPVPPVTVRTPAPKTPKSSDPAAAADPTVAPTYPDDFVGGPEFNTTAGRQEAGTASVVKLKDGSQSYIVSARHLLGPDGGFPKQTAAKDVPDFVKSIEITSFNHNRHRYEVTGLLVPTQRLEAGGGGLPIDDMAIYQNHDTAAQDQALPLANQAPAIGTPVWVVARVRGGVPDGQVLQGGKVTYTSTSNWIMIQFDNDKIVTAGASGAPALNAAGEVVGVYSSHTDYKGHVLGYLIPSTLIVQNIQKAPPVAQ